MAGAKHTPPGDGSFRASLVRNLGGAVGLVVLVAAVFWAIGTLGGDAGPPVAADGASTSAAPAPDASEEPEAPATEDPEPPATPEPTEAADDGDADEADEPAPADEPDEGDTDEGDTDEPDPADDTDEPAAPAVDPGSVTIQVLDGVKDDGGSAADGVASQLTGAGYDVIARNDALAYDVTTVLYNPGNEAAARQVAADLGGAEVREQPGNLSTRVSLHVVVGRDRA